MKQFLLKIWQNEEGAETAEWLVVVALLVVLGLAVYAPTGPLYTALSGLATNIAAAVNPLGG